MTKKTRTEWKTEQDRLDRAGAQAEQIVRALGLSAPVNPLDVVKAESNMPAYRLSKLALNGLTLSYAGDLKGKVAVNSLDPGWLKTDLGGPNAPGEPPDGAVRMLELATKPFSVTGGFWYGAEPIDF